MEGDGDTDIVGASKGGQLYWWENDGSYYFTRHEISEYYESTVASFVSDIDDDGDNDILSATYVGSVKDRVIIWWENDGHQNFTKHSLGIFTYSWDVFANDVDGDKDIDILAAASEAGIAWWENDGSQGFTIHQVPDFSGAQTLFPIDLDADGDIDVLSNDGSHEIVWWDNDGNQNFIKQLISDNYRYNRDVSAADIDNDGDLDVLSAASTPGLLTYWEKFMDH
jgi:hypothetical protein